MAMLIEHIDHIAIENKYGNMKTTNIEEKILKHLHLTLRGENVSNRLTQLERDWFIAHYPNEMVTVDWLGIAKLFKQVLPI